MIMDTERKARTIVRAFLSVQIICGFSVTRRQNNVKET